MSSDAQRRLRTPIGEMVLLDGGVILHTLDHGAMVDAEAARGVLDATRQLAAGGPVAVVVDLRAIGFADRASRDAFSADPAGGIEIATALVAGPRASEFLAGLFIKSSSGRPTELFRDPETAITWAEGQVRAHRRS